MSILTTYWFVVLYLTQDTRPYTHDYLNNYRQYLKICPNFKWQNQEQTYK